MKLTENPSEIVIRYVPVVKWLAGVVLGFAFGVFCVWLIYTAIVNPGELMESGRSGRFDSFQILILLAAGILAIIFESSLISLIFAPLTIVTIDRKAKRVEIRKLRLSGQRVERFYFFQIETFKSYKTKVEFFSWYSLALVLANRKLIKLKIPIGYGRQSATKTVKKLNKFMKSAELSE